MSESEQVQFTVSDRPPVKAQLVRSGGLTPEECEEVRRIVREELALAQQTPGIDCADRKNR